MNVAGWVLTGVALTALYGVIVMAAMAGLSRARFLVKSWRPPAKWKTCGQCRGVGWFMLADGKVIVVPEKLRGKPNANAFACPRCQARKVVPR